MILIIDNYDSFTYNLYQYSCEIDSDVKVIRNDALTLEEIKMLQPSAIIFSPGPGHPKDAGIMEEIIKTYYTEIPMLGICLGHQAIAEVFSSKITHALHMLHGESDLMQVVYSTELFNGLSEQFQAARYHSLIVSEIGNELQVIATSLEGEIMAIQHKQYPIYGVQFHPESIMTPEGKRIIKNFLKGTITSC